MLEGRTWRVYCFWEKKYFEFEFERVQRGFLSEWTGNSIPCRGAQDGKGTGTVSGKSGTRNLGAKSIRSGAESTGGCVKLKTVTEIRQNSARDTFLTVS